MHAKQELRGLPARQAPDSCPSIVNERLLSTLLQRPFRRDVNLWRDQPERQDPKKLATPTFCHIDFCLQSFIVENIE